MPQDLEQQPRRMLPNRQRISKTLSQHMPQHHRIQKNMRRSLTGFRWKATLHPLAREEGHSSNWHKHLCATVDSSSSREEARVPTERSPP